MYTAILAGYINSKVLMAKFIRSMYFLKKPKELMPAINLAGKDNFIAKLMTIKVDFFNYFCSYSRYRK